MGTSRATPAGELSVLCSTIPWDQLPDTPQLLVAKSHCHQALVGFFQCHTCADAEAPAWQPRCTLAIHLYHILSATLLQKPFPTLQTHNTFAVAAGSSSPGQTPSPSLRLPAQEMPLLVTAPRLPHTDLLILSLPMVSSSSNFYANQIAVKYPECHWKSNTVNPLQMDDLAFTSLCYLQLFCTNNKQHTAQKSLVAHL